jgi:Tfp pilus assembly protein PilO
LIIDVNGVAARHGLALKNIKTSANSSASSQSNVPPSARANQINVPNTYDTMTLTFNVSSKYETFIDFLRDLEASLRIMDISRITLNANDTGIYEYGVEVKTYWLKQ